jgi:energy-converting hydrogenase A subunit A
VAFDYGVSYYEVLYYGISTILSVILGILVKLPIKIDSDSFEGNALFPTIFVALGLTAIIDYLFGLNVVVCVIIGITSALFSKYVNRIFNGVEYGN